jgi:hypothetical protein
MVQIEEKRVGIFSTVLPQAGCKTLSLTGERHVRRSNQVSKPLCRLRSVERPIGAFIVEVRDRADLLERIGIHFSLITVHIVVPVLIQF